MKIGLISAAYPPDLDGIGDYTWWLARALAERRDVEKPVIVFTRKGHNHAPAKGVKIVPFFDPVAPGSFQQLDPLMAAAGIDEDLRFPLNWIILQYNPFSWAKRGFCASIPATLWRLRRLRRRPKIAVIFHETFTREAGIKNLIMRTWQRIFCKSVASMADCNLVSVEAYARDINLWSRGTSKLLPAGSNLPFPDIDKDEAKRRLGFSSENLVMGTFGTPHLSRKWQWMEEALAETSQINPNVRFLFVGSGGSGMHLRHSAGQLCVTGAVSQEAAARAIRAIDIFVAPFADGYSTRRGSVAAALQQGIPIVSTDGYRTDQVLRDYAGRSFELVQADDKRGFINKCLHLASQPAERERLAPEARAFFDRFLSWEIIAGTMVQHLKAESERTGDDIGEAAPMFMQPSPQHSNSWNKY
jgi:glycosyltransferase involved in cell wall biosynthesis